MAPGSEDMPRHIAVIMDGNGRWAQKRLMPRTMGHRAGMNALKRVVKTMGELNIPYLTVFAFSTENWKRPSEEVDYLMNLLVEYLLKELQELHNNNVRVNILGDYYSLPQRCRLQLQDALRKTRRNSGLSFNIALNYGARNEILTAARKAAALVASGQLSIDAIDDDLFSSFLSTSQLPDPDLLIRTAGEMRLSNFLLWQIAYTEIWVTDQLWPDFTESDLMEAIAAYKGRDRRFGGLSQQEQGEDHA